jgi:Flp pilus assembly protein TadG
MKVQSAQKGIAAVEAAIILPVFILVLFAIMDMGIALYNKAIITNASREAARSAIVLRSPTLTLTQIQALVGDFANGIVPNYCGTQTGSSHSNVVNFRSGVTCISNVSWQHDNHTGGCKIKVTVTYDYYSLALHAIPSFAVTTWYPLTLLAVTTMHMENNAAC